MPTDPKETPERKPDQEAPEMPRTDLTPEREPYYEGYFGTEEEEGVEREEDSGDVARRAEESGDAARRAEESAGGDREIS